MILRTKLAGFRWVVIAVVTTCALTGAMGCAFTNETITPPTDLSAMRSRRGGGREILVVSPFLDRRPQRHRCGMQKNGHNMDAASLLCSVSPAIFLAQLLQRELWAEGFRVITDRKAAGLSTVVVSGAVEQFFIEPKLNYFTSSLEADIWLSLTVQTRDGFIAERRFFVKGSEGTYFLSLIDKQAVSDRAVRELMLDSVGAIANLMDSRSPALPSSHATRLPAVTPETAGAP